MYSGENNTFQMVELVLYQFIQSQVIEEYSVVSK